MIPLLFLTILLVTIFAPVSKSKKILLCGVILTIFGILAVYSVSTYESFHHTAGRLDIFGEPSNYFFFKQQIKSIIISLVLGFIVYKIPLNFFTNHKRILGFSAIAFILQAIALFLGEKYFGARGWIYLGFTTFQPSEFYKIAYVLFMSSWLIRKQGELKNSKFVLSFITINVIALGIFIFVPDFGSILILGIISIIMVWYAGLAHKKIGIILGTAFLAFLVLLGILNLFSRETEELKTTTSGGQVITQKIIKGNKFLYLKNRLAGFFFTDVDKEKKGINWQNYQAMLAIGGGGFWGQGYGKGLQKFGYIPIAQSDFIFAAYAEEIGFIGNVTLLGIYFFMMYCFISKLKNNRDMLTKLVGIGLISTIIVQMFINIGVNLGIVPNTGITLPFVSHGGTAFMANVIQLVLLYKITRQNELGYQKK